MDERTAAEAMVGGAGRKEVVSPEVAEARRRAQYLADWAWAQDIAWALRNPEQAVRDMALCDENQKREDEADAAWDAAEERRCER